MKTKKPNTCHFMHNMLSPPLTLLSRSSVCKYFSHVSHPLTRKVAPPKILQHFSTAPLHYHVPPRTQQVTAQLPALQTGQAGAQPSGVRCGKSARNRHVCGGSAWFL